MVIITDEKDIVKEIALPPGPELRLPKGWHCYFPMTQEIPAIGQKFIPSLIPWDRSIIVLHVDCARI